MEAYKLMNILKIKKNDEIIFEYVEDASTFFRRFMGLMYRKSIPMDHGLLLTPCNEIHTFGMRFSIDAVTLSKDNKVIFIDRDIKPNKIRKSVANGYKVLELNAGVAAELEIEIGDHLEFI